MLNPVGQALTFYRHLKAPGQPAPASVGGLVRDKAVMALMAVLLLANGACSCLESTVGNYLERELGLSATQACCTHAGHGGG